MALSDNSKRHQRRDRCERRRRNVAVCLLMFPTRSFRGDELNYRSSTPPFGSTTNLQRFHTMQEELDSELSWTEEEEQAIEEGIGSREEGPRISWEELDRQIRGKHGLR